MPRSQNKAEKDLHFPLLPGRPRTAEIVTDYVDRLVAELRLGPADPLFPATRVGRAADRGFAAMGLTRRPWSSGGPCPQGFSRRLRGGRIAVSSG